MRTGKQRGVAGTFLQQKVPQQNNHRQTFHPFAVSGEELYVTFAQKNAPNVIMRHTTSGRKGTRELAAVPRLSARPLRPEGRDQERRQPPR
jgi:hypothetical protein